MAAWILTVNRGSSSLKFALFDRHRPVALCRGLIQCDANGTSLAVAAEEQAVLPEAVNRALGQWQWEQGAEPGAILGDWLQRSALASEVAVVCHRVVHGGDLTEPAVALTARRRQQLEALVPMAPLHQPLCLALVDSLMTALPAAQSLACCDTVFHHTLPSVERQFALPAEWAERGVRRYGFHGLSYQYIASALAPAGPAPRTVVAHLGSGASLCALRDGQSVATTMSFSPLDGLTMATRCGAIDAGAVLYMAGELGMTPAEIDDLLQHRSGLLGLSGISGDVRTLLASREESAVFALAYYVRSICRGVAAMAAALEGLDALVFTGGVGWHQPAIRAAVCERLGWLGVELDDAANERGEGSISRPCSPVQVLAMATDEEQVMASNAQTWLRAEGRVKQS